MTDSHKTLTVLKPRVLKRKESRSGESNRRRPLTSLTPYRWATPAHTAMMDNGSIFWLRQMSGRVVRKESSLGAFIPFERLWCFGLVGSCPFLRSLPNTCVITWCELRVRVLWLLAVFAFAGDDCLINAIRMWDLHDHRPRGEMY